MKIYVLPVEHLCNARCQFCITKNRGRRGKEYLDVDELGKLKKYNIDTIEITGGGEPLLHPKIGLIAKICSQIATTRIYTNGQLLLKNQNLLRYLSEVGLSRAHYSDETNSRIMGVNYNMSKFSSELKNKIKLSLLVHKSGISKIKEVLAYLNWAKVNKIPKVVLRELISAEGGSDLKYYANEFISLRSIADKLKKHFRVASETAEKIILDDEKINIEIDLGNCECRNDFLILRPDGIYKSWNI